MKLLLENWRKFLKEDDDIYTDRNRQSAKEQAIELALKDCRALSRDGLDMYAIDQQGKKHFIVAGKDYDTLWHDTLIALQGEIDETST